MISRSDLSRADFETFILWSVGCNVAGFVTTERLEALAAHPLLGLEQDLASAVARDPDRLRSQLRRRCADAVAEFGASERPLPADLDMPDNLEAPQMLEAMRIWFSPSPKSLQGRRKKIGQIGRHVSAATVHRHYEGPMAALTFDVLSKTPVPRGDGLGMASDTPLLVEVEDEPSDSGRSRNSRGALAALLGVAATLLVGGLLFQSWPNNDSARRAPMVLGPSSNIEFARCGPIELRSGAEIPLEIDCAIGVLQTTGDRRVGWNGRISAWEVDGPIEARAIWEDWADGTPDPSGVNPWTVSGQHLDGDTENDRYQEIEVFADRGGRLTIWENHDRTGLRVTFTYVDEG